MNKTQLIHEIAQRSAIRKETVRTLLNTYADLVMENLVRGESVTVPGFGTYTTTNKPARSIQHILTRRIITVPRHRAATFRPSSKLKIKLNAVKGE